MYFFCQMSLALRYAVIGGELQDPGFSAPGGLWEYSVALRVSIATSLVISLVQPPGFLLDDGILILIQTVLLSFERWVSICP